MTALTTKRRILVVDNEPDITITLQVGLEEGGSFDVDAFTDPDLALKSFKPNFYDLGSLTRFRCSSILSMISFNV